MNHVRWIALACLLPLTAPADAIDLSVTGLDGITVTGKALKFAPEIVLATSEGEQSFAWNDVIEVRPAVAAPAPPPPVAEKPAVATGGPLQFDLADGSLFGGRITDATESDFIVTLASGQTCKLTLDAVRVLRSPTASASALQTLNAVTGETERREDVAVIARDGREATIRGAVRRIEPSKLTFAFQGKDRPLEWSIVSGVVFANASPRGATCIVRTRGGESFAGRVSAGDEHALTLQSSFFKDLLLPWKQIERVECRSERLTFLSDLRPAAYVSQPFLGGKWELGLDRSLTGKPIAVGGQSYAKGLVMHSRARVLYVLGGRYKQFAALAGIVDEMAPRGNVTMTIAGRETVLWQAENVRGGEPPREVLVDVTGVDALELIVDFGEDLDVSDHACWAFARLIR